MTFSIENIGKIRNSSIEMQGITVIAGENNTGKSTFGKVLYCMFNAFFNADATIHRERVQDIKRILVNGIPRIHGRSINIKTIDGILSENNIRSIVERLVAVNASGKPGSRPNEKIIDILCENLERSVAISENDIQKMIVTRYFKGEFAGKINHLNKKNASGKISLAIKEKKINVTIKNNDCSSFSDDVGLLHDAIYMDTPFILDDINNYYNDGFTGFYNMTRHRDDLLERLMKNGSENTTLEEVVIKQKINKLLSNIHIIVGGEFKEDENNLYFLEDGFKKPLPLISLSTGIKAFLVIKRLLELGEIKEHGVLILDEPEIHLHPDWQLRFAEILVLLQKEFNLTILLTTHSPYFLHAIEIYSGKHDIKDQTNYYLAENNGDTADVREITDNIDVVYKQLAMPFQKLEDMAYEE